MPFRPENRHLTLSLLLIIMGVIAVGVGVQAWLVHQDDEARDAQLRQQERRDDAYADCLTEFAADLVESLRAVRAANRELDDARDRKDSALDQLVEISAQAQATGAETQADLPPGLIARYERVLAERIDAQRDFTRLKRQAVETQDENPLESPKVRCRR